MPVPSPSVKPDHVALIVVSDTWKSMSAAGPSTTAPPVGGSTSEIRAMSLPSPAVYINPEISVLPSPSTTVTVPNRPTTGSVAVSL